jgi:hypothetical protein
MGFQDSKNNFIDNRFRFERKFLLRNVDTFHLHKLVLFNRGDFIERFHVRKVNNIYLDTPNLDLYSANLKGFSNRKKIRIRWYGDMFGKIDKPVLEIKSKEGNVNHKTAFPLGEFYLSEGIIINDELEKAFDNSKIPGPLILNIKSLKPVLLNQYERKYYESMSLDIRLTLDWNLRFFGISRYGNYFLNRTSEDDLSVLELKYQNDLDGVADYIANQFPFRITKSSKYVLGINRVFLLSDFA